RVIRANKRSAVAPLRLLGFPFTRLGDPHRLAHVPHFETCETAYREVLAQLANSGRDELRNADRLIFNEGLLVQANFFIKLAHLAFNNLLDHLWGLASGGSLAAIDVL